MADRRDHKRILIYSHDSFGLGHLRRCRAIAHSLVDADSSLSVLILSGSPIIGSFDFRSRVDFVRIPGVIKLRNGEYVSLNLHIDIDETLAMRSSIIRHTAEIFDPDILIVDKEPLGLRGEVRPTLDLLQARGTPLVLGLRDVMDEPERARKRMGAQERDPGAARVLRRDLGLWPAADLRPAGRASTCRRACAGAWSIPAICGATCRPAPAAPRSLDDLPDGEFLLVTPGGGGDGDGLIDWVLAAYEHDPGSCRRRCSCSARSCCPSARRRSPPAPRGSPNVRTLTFDAQLEDLMARAARLVAMGGYNTFCEILSFDKPALIVPRTTPRLEQFIRAQRAAELGLVAMLPDDDSRDPRDDGGGAAAAAAAAAPVRGGRPGAARRHGERQPAGAEMAGARAAPARWRARGGAGRDA